jgi:hypothetical protein
MAKLRDMTAREIADLEASQREAVSSVWLDRAQGELSTAAVFEEIVAVGRALGLVPEVLSMLARASGDELRHARRCHELAELYAGHSLAPPVALGFEAPKFGEAPAHINGHLLLIYQSCLNEGIATVYLQENLRLVRAKAAHELIHELLRDDLVHARIGWAHLASPVLSVEVRSHVAAALPTLLGLVRVAWLRSSTASDFDCPEHGCLGRFRHAALVSAAIEELILPGFAHLGFSNLPQ